jgi:GTP cyclohydrolase I
MVKVSRFDSDEGYKRIDQYEDDSLEKLQKHYKEILEELGEEPEREGLKDTPERVAKAMQFFTHGYQLKPEKILEQAKFDEQYSEMVIVKDIEIYSLCEHHLMPFFGRAHVAYIPNGHIVGLSKIARVTEAYARRLQVQERLTCQIRDCIHRTLEPLGVAVVIEARHLCMMMRGIEKQNSIATTSAFTGEFEKQPTRNEFIDLISADLGN